MSDLKEFRSIADGYMSDIVADSRLKEKVLAGCGKKHQAPIGKLLAAAACFVLILGALNFSGLLQLRTQPQENINPESYIAEPGFNTLAADAVQDNALVSPSGIQSWELESPEAAKKVFGGSFLQPSYIPESFKLYGIFASGDGNRAQEILLQYRDGERYFMVVENRQTAEATGLNNYESIEINGVKGYKKAVTSGLGGSEAAADTEVHWFRDGVHYAVSGQITGEEAVRIAEGMK